MVDGSIIFTSRSVFPFVLFDFFKDLTLQDFNFEIFKGVHP